LENIAGDQHRVRRRRAGGRRAKLVHLTLAGRIEQRLGEMTVREHRSRLWVLVLLVAVALTASSSVRASTTITPANHRFSIALKTGVVARFAINGIATITCTTMSTTGRLPPEPHNANTQTVGSVLILTALPTLGGCTVSAGWTMTSIAVNGPWALSAYASNPAKPRGALTGGIESVVFQIRDGAMVTCTVRIPDPGADTFYGSWFNGSNGSATEVVAGNLIIFSVTPQAGMTGCNGLTTKTMGYGKFSARWQILDTTDTGRSIRI
jgi:hypothetical protein